MLKRRLKIEKWKIRMGDTPGLAYFFDLKLISGIPLRLANEGLKGPQCPPQELEGRAHRALNF